MSKFEGWANEATYQMAHKLDTMSYLEYIKWLKINPSGTVKEYCELLKVDIPGVDWDEIEELFGKK